MVILALCVTTALHADPEEHPYVPYQPTVLPMSAQLTPEQLAETLGREWRNQHLLARLLEARAVNFQEEIAQFAEGFGTNRGGAEILNRHSLRCGHYLRSTKLLQQRASLIFGVLTPPSLTGPV